MMPKQQQSTVLIATDTHIHNLCAISFMLVHRSQLSSNEGSKSSDSDGNRSEAKV